MRFSVLRGARWVALVAAVAPVVAEARPAQPGLRRLREMSALRSAARRDAYTRDVVATVEAGRAWAIDSVGDVGARRLVERLGWVPLAADPALRKVTVATVMRKIGQRSRALSAALLRPEHAAVAAYDVLFIGASVHTAITANTLSTVDAGAPITMLTVEASREIGGVFRAVGATVARNTANGAALTGRPRQRRFGPGDRNPSEGPLGDPDADGQEHPELGLIADTATVNLHASGSEILLETRVLGVERRDEVAGGARWPARLRVRLRGPDGVERFVFASAVVDGSGPGPRTTPGLDAESQALVAAHAARVDHDRPEEVPPVLHYLDALALADRSPTGRDPYRAPPATGRRARPRAPSIAVVGGRDGGRTFLEWLFGQAPAVAYSGDGKVDSAQRGDVGDVYFFVGPDGPADSQAFLRKTLARYLRLVEKVSGTGDAPPRARLRARYVTRIRELPDGRFRLTDSSGRTLTVDRVVFATGFGEPGAIPGDVEPVLGTIEGREGPRTIAMKLRDREVYRIGTAAGRGIFNGDDMPSEHLGGIYALARRDRALARTVLARVERATAHLALPRDERIAITLGARSRAPIAAAGSRRPLRTPLSTLVLRAELGELLGRLRVRATSGESALRFSVSQRDGALTVDGPEAAVLAGLLVDSPLLIDQLRATTASGRTIAFEAPVRDARVVRTELTITQ